MWMYGFAIVAVVCLTCKETYSLELEEFLSSLSNKKDDSSSEESQEASQVNQQELLQFAKRSGLMAQPQQSSTSNDALNNQKLLQMLQQLQTMNRQQNLVVYSPEYSQASSQTETPQRPTRATESTQSSSINANPNLAYSYLKPASVSSSSLAQDQQNSIQSAAQQQTQHRYAPQYMDAPTLAAVQKHNSQSTNAKQSLNDANANLAYRTQSPNDANLAYSNPQREINDKSAEKEDRQGQYPYDAYSSDSGYAHSRNPVYAHEPQYAHHEPVHHKPLSLPIPQIAIKFDPLGLLKLLFSGLPKPFFNLNGKIFLGLELGKGAGLAVRAPGHYGGGHQGGSKNLITIG